MSNKTKGIIIPPLITLLIIVLGIVIGAVVASTSTDGWAALGAILMVFWFLGLSIIVIYVVGFVLYYKKKSDWGLGLLIGMTGTLGFFGIAGILISLYNAIINLPK